MGRPKRLRQAAPAQKQALNDIFHARIFGEGYSSLSRIKLKRQSVEFLRHRRRLGDRQQREWAIDDSALSRATAERPSEKLEIALPPGTAPHRHDTTKKPTLNNEAEMAEYQRPSPRMTLPGAARSGARRCRSAEGSQCR